MLSDMKCTHVDRAFPPLKAFEAGLRMAEVPGWNLAGTALIRDYKFSNFTEAMAFVNRVAGLAEREDHHPDMHVSYNRVRLELSTHSIGGLSLNDFIMAAKINLL